MNGVTSIIAFVAIERFITIVTVVTTAVILLVPAAPRSDVKLFVSAMLFPLASTSYSSPLLVLSAFSMYVSFLSSHAAPRFGRSDALSDNSI